MLRSPSHRHVFLGELDWLLLPRLALKHCRLFTQGDQPLAFVSWAFVSDEVEARLKRGQIKLKPSEWRSGDRCWIVDLVAPGAKAEPFLQALKDGPLADQNVHLLKLDPETRKPEVVVVEKKERAEKDPPG